MIRDVIQAMMPAIFFFVAVVLVVAGLKLLHAISEEFKEFYK
jgi:hypothetical protein